ncbi:E3 ubiquitin-protein ligase MARCHF2-like [Amblyomma americanum]
MTVNTGSSKRYCRPEARQSRRQERLLSSMVVVMSPIKEESVVLEVDEALISEVAPAALHSPASAASTCGVMEVSLDVESAAKEDLGSSRSFLDEESGSSTTGHDSTSSVCDLDGHTLADSSLSLSSDGEPMCRICFFGGRKQPLLEPCNCRGTIGYVHKECLESWIERTADGRCQICHYQFTVRKKVKSTWRLLGDSKARGRVLGYLALGTLFSASIAFIFSLAWLYVLRLPARIGDQIVPLAIVLLAVQNVLWHYFPFLSFMYAFDALKEWHQKNTSLKLVVSETKSRGNIWLTLCGPRTPILSSGTVTMTSLVA